MDDLILVRYVHNPSVHRIPCHLYPKQYAKPVTEEKVRKKHYLTCATCLPGFYKE